MEYLINEMATRWRRKRHLTVTVDIVKALLTCFVGQNHGHISQSATGCRYVGQSEGVPERDGSLVAQRQSPDGGPLAGEAGTGGNIPRTHEHMNAGHQGTKGHTCGTFHLLCGVGFL